jgi:hypothetical protein
MDSKFDPEKGSFKTWVSTVTKNIDADYYRCKKNLHYTVDISQYSIATTDENIDRDLDHEILLGVCLDKIDRF